MWVVLAAGLVFAVVLTLDWKALAHIWGRWLHGPVADEWLWGLPMFWWGRIGKLLQLGAAVTSVLDLIGPERLRRWGERSTERVRATRARARTYREASRLLAQLAAAEERLEKDLELIGTGRLDLAGLDDPPAGLDITAYRNLLSEVLAAFGGKVRCDSCHESYLVKAPFPTLVSTPARFEHKWKCPHGRGVLEPLVEAAVRSTWTMEEVAAFRAAEGIHTRTVGISWLLGTALVGLPILFLVVGRVMGDVLLPSWLLLVLGVVGYLVFVFVSALAILGSEPGAERVAGATFVDLWAAVARAPGALTRAIAYLLDRTRPGHPILIVSLFLLVIGVHFDLLAG